MDSQPKQKRVLPLTLVLIIIIVLLAAAAVVLAVGKLGGDEEPETEQLGNASTPLIGYEEGVTVVDDPDALQNAVNEAYAQAAKNGVPVEYQNNANSTDGKAFDCYIANPVESEYDIYIQIFADVELTDQLYLSKLIQPGNAKREIQLERKLAAGNHLVYVVYTQVEDDHATVRDQAIVTMDFVVTK